MDELHDISMTTRRLYCFAVALLVCSSCSERADVVAQSTDSIGFRTISAVDSSRLYKPEAPPTDDLHFRPMFIDVWYPAAGNAADSTLRFGDILGLLEQRANVLGAPKTHTGLTRDVAKSFSEGFGCSTPDSVLRQPTRSRREASVRSGKFPLIIYLASYNALSYDNYVLMEDLAKQGYVVAVVGSIGRYPGDMTMKNADLMEQVRDAAFALKRMRTLASVDATRIGVLGYSWGGFAGAVLAMSEPDIDAVVSFDGSEFHHYGESKAEDADFDATVNDPTFEKASIRVPYLRLESTGARKKDPARNDSIYDFREKLAGEHHIFRIDSATHQDFSSLPDVVREPGKCKKAGTYRLISDLTVQYFNQHLKQDKDAFAKVLQPNLNKRLRSSARSPLSST